MDPVLLQGLRDAVAGIPCWGHTSGRPARRDRLRIDDDALEELVEAWIPVITPHGPGVLVWDNCD